VGRAPFPPGSGVFHVLLAPVGQLPSTRVRGVQWRSRPNKFSNP
jgi:hypothetical protein